jgi:hypothetical protein
MGNGISRAMRFASCPPPFGLPLTYAKRITRLILRGLRFSINWKSGS